MNTDRTDVINEALQEYVAEVTADEQFRQRVAEAYYEGRIELDLVEALLGTEPDESVDVYDGETVEFDSEEWIDGNRRRYVHTGESRDFES